MGAGGDSGKMPVICLSESAEVLMQGLEDSITRAAAKMVPRSRALTQLPPPPYSLRITVFTLYHTLRPSLFHFSPSLSLTHTSFFFLGPSPLCLIILFWFFSISTGLCLCASPPCLWLNLFCLSLLFSNCSHPSMHPPSNRCLYDWPWFCLHNLRHQTQFPVLSFATVFFSKGSSSLLFFTFVGLSVILLTSSAHQVKDWDTETEWKLDDQNQNSP